ncbi:MAG: hybrid sensor histidine kinase/response regulator [Ktedonobacteraceae bacterium]
MDEPHILIVDDDLALLQALPHMIALRIHGVQVDTAASAQEAIERVQEDDYDAIVSDIKMPGMDGLELLAKIQHLRPEIPTLLITGHSDQELITQALRAGAYDFIQKPIDRVYFVSALHRATQTRQLRRKVQEQQQSLEQHAQLLEQLVEQQERELLTTQKVMDLLVRDLVDTALIESNRLVLHRTRCDLVELCQQVLDAYTIGAGYTITFESTEGPAEVEVDRDRISQVLIHLISNAHKYSPADSPITIQLYETTDMAIVEVCDSGIGIADEMLPHLFERFYRLPEDGVQPGSRPSVGLGLSLSQRIVAAHGGSLEVQSIPGQGSTFSVVLPRSTAASTEHANDTPIAGDDPSPFQAPQWMVS